MESEPILNTNTPNTNITNVINAITNLSSRPEWDDYFMSIAYLISKRSSCHRLHVGCVIVKDNRIVVTGYNGHIAKTEHISIVKDGHEQATIHAEMNAICDASKRGAILDGCTAYISHFPCLNCTKMLIGAGIQSVVYGQDYKNDDIAYKLLDVAKVNIVQYKTEKI